MKKREWAAGIEVALGHPWLTKATLLPRRAGWESAARQPATEDLGFVHPLESPRERIHRENQPGKALLGQEQKQEPRETSSPNL